MNPLAWFLERFIGSTLVLGFGLWALLSANVQLIAAIVRMFCAVWFDWIERD